MTERHQFSALLLIALAAVAVPASAQESTEGAEKRTRIILGPQLSPSWPGADKFGVGPYIDVSRTREGAFEYEAPDESFGQPLVHAGNFAFGPAFGFIGKRKASDIGADLPKVGFTVEAGGFAQAYLTPSLRVRAEGRKGLSGHKGWVGEISADYIARQGDDWLFSIGPRVSPLTTPAAASSRSASPPATTACSAKIGASHSMAATTGSSAMRRIRRSRANSARAASRRRASRSATPSEAPAS